MIDFAEKAQAFVCELDECFSLKPSFSTKAEGLIRTALTEAYNSGIEDAQDECAEEIFEENSQIREGA